MLHTYLPWYCERCQKNHNSVTRADENDDLDGKTGGGCFLHGWITDTQVIGWNTSTFDDESDGEGVGGVLGLVWNGEVLEWRPNGGVIGGTFGGAYGGNRWCSELWNRVAVVHRRFVDMLVEYDVPIMVWWCYLDIVLVARKIAGDGGRKHRVYTERDRGRWNWCSAEMGKFNWIWFLIKSNNTIRFAIIKLVMLHIFF